MTKTLSPRAALTLGVGATIVRNPVLVYCEAVIPKAGKADASPSSARQRRVPLHAHRQNLSMLGFYRTSLADPPPVEGSSAPFQDAHPDAESANGGIEAPASVLTDYMDDLNVVMQTLFGVNAQLDRWNFFLHNEVTGPGVYEGTMDDIEEPFSFEVAFAVAADEDVLEEELTAQQLEAWEAADGRTMAVYGRLSTAAGSIAVVGNAASVQQSGQPRVSRFYFADFWDGTEWWAVEPVLPEWWEIGCPPIPSGLCNCDQQCVDAACSVFIINANLAIDTFNFTVHGAGTVCLLWVPQRRRRTGW